MFRRECGSQSSAHDAIEASLRLQQIGNGNELVSKRPNVETKRQDLRNMQDRI